MTNTPPDTADPHSGPRVSRDELRDLTRLRRTVGPDRRLAGVAGGLARHLDVDPVIVRVGLVVLVFFGGAGLLLYAAGWLLLPEDGGDRALVGMDDRSRTVALVVVGALAAAALLADSVGQWGFPWPLVGVAAVVLVVLTVTDRNRPRVRPPMTAGVGPVATAWEVRPQPRRRGPVLFWFTLALAALACAALGVADLAGLDVAPAAYPAVVTGICGLLLIVGSVWGRPGGLVLVGLLAAAATAAALVVGPWHGAGRLAPRPAVAADLRSDYRLTSGEIVLDLTDVADPGALAGRTVHLGVRTGQIIVVVPDDLAVHVDATATGAGQLQLFDRQWDGDDVSGSATRAGGDPASALTLDATVLFGQVDVRTAR